MAAKVLLGVVALAAIVGSPFAYNHFKSPSGETQKEGEVKNGQTGTAEKPANTAPEVKADKPAVNEQVPEQNGDGQRPQTDPCNLDGVQTWEATGGTLSSQNHCVREVIQNQRQN